MIKIVDKWKTSLEGYITKELGPFPDFDYIIHNQEEDLPWDQVIWRVSYENNKPALNIYPRRFDKRFNKLRFQDNIIKKQAVGYIIFSLVHDLVHLYQMNHLIEKKYDTKDWMKRAWEHCNWIEGLAQLYALKICEDMDKKSKVEKSSVFKKKDIKELVSDSLKSKRYKMSLYIYIKNFLFSDTRSLRNVGYIKEDEFSFSNYPFEINEDIVKMVEAGLSLSDSLKSKDNITKSELRRDSYLWGAYQLSNLIAEEDYTLEKLMVNPLSNWEIRNIFASSGFNSFEKK